MAKQARTIFIFAACLLIGLFTAIQMKQVNGQHLYVSAKTLTDYETTIKSEEADLENLKKRYEETKGRLAEYESGDAFEENGEDTLRAKLEEEQEIYGILLGVEEVKGPGITITIDDATREIKPWESENNLLVHDQDLLMIISALKESGAEAISINGQRLTARSSISCSGSTVRINGRTYACPFEIKVIGDPARLSSTLLGPSGYGTIMMQDDLIFRIATEDEIIMKGYTESLGYEYMEALTTVEGAEESEEEDN